MRRERERAALTARTGLQLLRAPDFCQYPRRAPVPTSGWRDFEDAQA